MPYFYVSDAFLCPEPFRPLKNAARIAMSILHCSPGKRILLYVDASRFEAEMLLHVPDGAATLEAFARGFARWPLSQSCQRLPKPLASGVG